MTNVVAVDWGTSSLRIWGLDASGIVTAKRRGTEGMFGLRPADFPKVLERHLSSMGVALGVPAIICGMAGAASGWVEAPYVDAPADLAAIADAGITTRTESRSVLILPGIAQRRADDPDVMRGEETLLLGAVIAEGIDGLVCLPGTHSKWARLADGRVTNFQTSMTGEAFSLFSKSSTLSAYASESSGDLYASDAFAAALKEAMDAPQKILHSLFSVRATPLLMGEDKASDMPARLSGLLIGLEIAGMRAPGLDDVTLISSGSIGQTYARALQLAGLSVRRLDSDVMVRAGLFHCAQHMLLKA